MSRRLLLLLALAALLRAEDSWKNVERIVAVADIHGGYNALVDLLRQTKLVDASNTWIGGKTHLIQLGDVVDRGADSRKVLDLLMALEKQAPKAGGYVHCLLGNHEAMNLYGDLRYTLPSEFAAYGNADSPALLEALWEKESRWIKPKPDAFAKQKWLAAHPPGWVEHRKLFAPDGRYGKWIRSHNTIIRVNETLFVHGGISPKYATKSLREINDRVGEELRDFSLLTNDGFVRDEQGPLWYRGIAKEDPAQAAAVQQMLERFNARRIVIGHTPTGGKILSLYGGAVTAIDVGLGDTYGSHRVCLILEGGRAFRFAAGEASPIP